MRILSPEEIRATVLDRLEQHLQVLGMRADEIESDFDLFGSGALDSLTFVDLLTSIEETLGQSLDWGELDFGKLETLDALVDQLHSLQACGKVGGGG